MPVRKTARQMPTITNVKRAVLGFVMPSFSLAGDAMFVVSVRRASRQFSSRQNGMKDMKRIKQTEIQSLSTKSSKSLVDNWRNMEGTNSLEENAQGCIMLGVFGKRLMRSHRIIKVLIYTVMTFSGKSLNCLEVCLIQPTSSIHILTKSFRHVGSPVSDLP